MINEYMKNCTVYLLDLLLWREQYLKYDEADHPGTSDPLPDPEEGRGRAVHPLRGQEDQPRPRLLGQLLHEREADRPSA